MTSIKQHSSECPIQSTTGEILSCRIQAVVHKLNNIKVVKCTEVDYKINARALDQSAENAIMQSPTYALWRNLVSKFRNMIYLSCYVVSLNVKKKIRQLLLINI